MHSIDEPNAPITVDKLMDWLGALLDRSAILESTNELKFKIFNNVWISWTELEDDLDFNLTLYLLSKLIWK